jgi:hypothetical protein
LARHDLPSYRLSETCSALQWAVVDRFQELPGSVWEALLAMERFQMVSETQMLDLHFQSRFAVVVDGCQKAMLFAICVHRIDPKA